MFLPELVGKQAFADPETRRKLAADLANPRPTTFHRRWDIVRVEKVAKTENKRYACKSVVEMAIIRGQDPLAAFLDLAFEENRTTLCRPRAGHSLRCYP